MSSKSERRMNKILRERSKINYREPEPETVDGNDPDYTVKSEPKSDSSSSGDELFSKKKKPNLPDAEKKYADMLLTVDEDAENETNEYRLQRLKNMEDRLTVLKTIDFDDDIKKLQCSTPVRKIKKTDWPLGTGASKKIIKPAAKPPKIPRKRSQRLLNRSLNEQIGNLSNHSETFQSFISVKDEYDHQSEPELIEDEINLCEPEEIQFLENLKAELNIPYDSGSDFSTCDFDKFCATVKSCHMFEEPLKIIPQRIVSMDFHPSENKLLLLSGDKAGNVGLWNLTENNGFDRKSHAYNVNCVSFSTQDKTKFFTTSLAGTVRQGDINSSSMNLIFSATDQGSSSHTTWHHELGRTLLVADSGNGTVRIVDLRAPNTNCPYFSFHKRSVRTVQTNPVDDNYFLTSSGMGYFGVWDLRHIDRDEPEPVILQDFKKGLTSAFYSHRGNYVLTTGNDDTIRVYQCQDNAAKEIKLISHNNHAGRWLSVFKARWQPNREDCFYVGSMMSNPKRIQAYKIDGTVIHEFTREDMVTYNPVVTVHPTKPIIVGGNSSGRIHVFSPFPNLNESGKKLF